MSKVISEPSFAGESVFEFSRFVHGFVRRETFRRGKVSAASYSRGGIVLCIHQRGGGLKKSHGRSGLSRGGMFFPEGFSRALIMTEGNAVHRLPKLLFL